jgi:hypothetical protein
VPRLSLTDSWRYNGDGGVRSALWAALAMARASGWPWVAEGRPTGVGGGEGGVQVGHERFNVGPPAQATSSHPAGAASEPPRLGV